MAYKTNGNTFFNDSSNLGPGVTGLSIDSEAGSITIGWNPVLGTVAAYAAGGDGPSPTPTVNTIQRFPFATDTNATNVGTLSAVVGKGNSSSSDTTGYISGGYGPISVRVSSIIKFSFSPSSTSSSIGNLTSGRYGGQGSSSTTNGYASSSFPNSQTIERFPFAVDANSVNVGTLKTYNSYSATAMNPSEAFEISGIFSTNIQKFPFSNESATSIFGNLAQIRRRGAGSSSTTTAYVAGGIAYPPPTSYLNSILKFPFATGTPVATVGNLAQTSYFGGSTSTYTHGYHMGGSVPGLKNTIEKFPFATDTNASSVGVLTSALQGVSSNQE